MTIAASRCSSTGASGLPLPLKGARDDPDYRSPLEYLDMVGAATISKPSPAPPKPSSSSSSSLFLNTKFTAAVLVACLAMAFSAWLWQDRLSGPMTAVTPAPNMHTLVSSFEETIEALSRFRTQDVVDVGHAASTTSASSDQARMAVQRWMDMKPVVSSIEDLLAQRQAKVTEAQSLEAKLRASATAYQAAREASELYRASASDSIALLRKNELDQEQIQAAINETAAEENDLHQRLQQHEMIIFELAAKRDAAEKQLVEVGRRVSEQQTENAALSDEVQYYQAQVNQHNVSVANAFNELKDLLTLQDTLLNEVAEKRLLLEHLRSKEKEKMDLLSTIVSIQGQFVAVAQENPHDEATVSLKALMDAEEQQIESLNAELTTIATTSATPELDEAAYESSLHRSRIRLQRVQHELRFESIRFIYESLPLGTSKTFPAVLATVASQIDQARERLDHIKSNITSAEQSLSVAERRIEENVSQIDRLKSFELDADSRYEMLLGSLKDAETAYRQRQQALSALKSEMEQSESNLAKVKHDYDAVIEQKRVFQKNILLLGETQLAQQRQLHQLQHDGKKMIQICTEDMGVAFRHLNNMNSKFDEVQQLATALSTLNEDIADLDQHLQQRSQRLLDSISGGYRHAKPFD